MGELIFVVVAIPAGLLVAFIFGMLQEDDPCAGGAAIILPMFGPVFGAIMLRAVLTGAGLEEWAATSMGVVYGLVGAILCIPAFMRGKHPPKKDTTGGYSQSSAP